MQEQSKSLLEAIKNYVEQCPFLSDIDLHIDQTDSEPVSYSIQTSGLIKISEDVLGNSTWQYNAILQSREYTADDLSRLNASAFTEQFIFYIDDCNCNQNYPQLPDSMTTKKIYADNGMLFALDDDGDRGIYQIQLHLIFEKETFIWQ